MTRFTRKKSRGLVAQIKWHTNDVHDQQGNYNHRGLMIYLREVEWYLGHVVLVTWGTDGRCEPARLAFGDVLLESFARLLRQQQSHVVAIQSRIGSYN